MDVRVRTLEPHVVQFEQRQVKLHDGAAHLDGRVARLGIDAADVCDGDDEIDVAHDLAEDEIRDIVDRQPLEGFTVEELDPLQCRRLDVGGRVPVSERVDTRDDVRLVVDALQSLTAVDDPAARLEQGDGLCGLHLMPRVAVARLLAVLVRCLDVELAEHLLERLTDLLFKKIFLVVCPCAALIEIERVGDLYLRVLCELRARAVRSDERTVLVKAECRARLEHERFQQRRDDGVVRHDICDLACEERRAVLHHLLEHLLCAAVLLL